MWVTAGVPISLLGAILCFPFFGISISTLTVMAFILVLGILVDDAIVIGETCSAWTAQELQPFVDALGADEALFVVSLTSSLAPDGDSELLGVFVDGEVIRPWILAAPQRCAPDRPVSVQGVGVVRAQVGSVPSRVEPAFELDDVDIAPCSGGEGLLPSPY